MLPTRETNYHTLIFRRVKYPTHNQKSLVNDLKSFTSKKNFGSLNFDHGHSRISNTLQTFV